MKKIIDATIVIVIIIVILLIVVSVYRTHNKASTLEECGICTVGRFVSNTRNNVTYKYSLAGRFYENTSGINLPLQNLDSTHIIIVCEENPSEGYISIGRANITEWNYGDILTEEDCSFYKRTIDSREILD